MIEVTTFLHPGDLGWELLLLFLVFSFVLLIITPAFVIFVWIKVYLKLKDKTAGIGKKTK
jgi:hypothetical protein